MVLKPHSTEPSTQAALGGALSGKAAAKVLNWDGTLGGRGAFNDGAETDWHVHD